MIFIYGLFDPIEAAHIRYIGVSNSPAYRLCQHVDEALRLGTSSYKCNWLRKVLDEGRFPETSVLREATTLEEAYQLEIQLIEEHLQAGHRLTNASSGGQGPLMHVVSNEARERISASLLGRKNGPHSAETIQKMREAQRRPEVLAATSAPHIGKARSPEVRAKIRATLTGHNVSEETRKKMSEARLGKPLSDEARKAQSAALTGRAYECVSCGALGHNRKTCTAATPQQGV
jgi:hypothetical protein